MNNNMAEMYRDSQRKLYNTLSAVEWVSTPDQPREPGNEWCPWCGNYRADGHTFGCQRQEALGITYRIHTHHRHLTDTET